MLKIITPPWIALGFYRGVKLYNYKYNYELIEYEKKEDKKYAKKPTYFYAECFGTSLYGGLLYINPFLLPITFSKEIYRLEVNLRNLDNEKEKDEYYRVI